MASTHSGWVWPEHPLSSSHPPKPYGRRQGTNLPTPSTTKHLPIDTNRQSTISSPTYLPCRQHHQPLPEGAKGNGGQKSAQSGGRISLCTQRVDPPIGPYAQIGSARRVLACRTPAATLASATEAPSTTSVLFIEVMSNVVDKDGGAREEHGQQTVVDASTAALSITAQESAHKRQRLGNGASADSEAWMNNFGGKTSGAPPIGGKGALQMGPPQKGDKPQTGAARQPPKPRECRLCHQHFPSGAKLFEHLPLCRAQRLGKGAIDAAAAGAEAEHTVPRANNGGVTRQAAATQPKVTLVEELAMADSCGYCPDDGPDITLIINENTVTHCADHRDVTLARYAISWASCPTRTAKYPEEDNVFPIITYVNTEAAAMGFVVGDEIRMLARTTHTYDDSDREEIFDNVMGLNAGAAGAEGLEAALEALDRDLMEWPDDLALWQIYLTRHAAIRPVPMFAQWPEEDNEPARAWAHAQLSITANGGLGDFCQCDNCAKVRTLRQQHSSGA